MSAQGAGGLPTLTDLAEDLQRRLANLSGLDDVTRDNDGRFRVHTCTGLSLTLTRDEWVEAMRRIVALAKDPEVPP